MNHVRVFSTLVAVLLCCPTFAAATLQRPDTLIFGGRKFYTWQIPMLGLWDYGEGSVGTGKERPPALWLNSITGKIDEKRVKTKRF